MKAVITGVAALALGMVGLVALHDNQKQPVGAATAPSHEDAPDVATISTGQKVDVAAHVPRQGFTMVEFTADF